MQTKIWFTQIYIFHINAILIAQLQCNECSFKIISSNEVSGEDILSTEMQYKPFGGRGFSPVPTGGAYRAPTGPNLVGTGLAAPSQEPHPRARPFGPRTCPPQSWK